MPRSFLVRKCGTVVRHRSSQLVEELRDAVDERQYVDDLEPRWQSTTAALEYHRLGTPPAVELGVRAHPARQHFAFTQFSDGEFENLYVLLRTVLLQLSTVLRQIEVGTFVVSKVGLMSPNLRLRCVRN